MYKCVCLLRSCFILFDVWEGGSVIDFYSSEMLKNVEKKCKKKMNYTSYIDHGL